MKFPRLLRLPLLLLSLALPGLGAAAPEFDFSTLSALPIQSGGRVKPFDTFARESARLVTGRESFGGFSPTALLLDWIAKPEDWSKRDFILVENAQLKAILQIPAGQSRVSPEALLQDEAFLDFVKSIQGKAPQKGGLNPLEKAAQTLFARLERFEDIESGDALAFIPVPGSEQWLSMGELRRAFDKAPKKMPPVAQELLLRFAEILKAYAEGDVSGFTAQGLQWAAILKPVQDNPDIRPSRLALEVFYNQLKPFRWAWVLHLAAALLFSLSLLGKAPKLFKAGLFFFGSALLLSGFGFTARCLIAGRPPVSNMYESIIWVTFGMTVFALVFEWVFKNRLFVLAGSLLAVLGFVLADNVPSVLDPSIQPLEPVLRDNFWLTIHVLTITLSYAAFLLSLGIGHAALWTLWRHPKDAETLKTQAQLIYRVVQVGVVLLAAGTILGGVWASYSWGRFWGWDPKETWALIALLGYVALLHGRLAGWLKEKGFVLGAIGAFLGVLMAWYGVNFVLGVGLHSYGFSKGGLPYVVSFVVLELALVAWVGLGANQKEGTA
ncbi:MAG TPA: cytochrome c biogenesis protein CcsA [bacterium]|nr:cytochrome c biogenesis protein CcsA [bacterium]